MKRKASFFICFLLVLAMLAGCSRGDGKESSLPSSGEGESSHLSSSEPSEGEGKKLQLVATIFPEYDWVRKVLGERADRAELSLLLNNGVDLHSFQPTSRDFQRIADADLFLYVGGESDEWAEEALKNAGKKKGQVINLMEVMGDKAKTEEVKEGMQAETAESGEDEEEEEKDEHVWLSLKNTRLFVQTIADRLSALDPEGKETYQKNAAAYIQQLDSLDQDYQKTVDQAKRKTLLFGDRFPFRYLVDDYGLDYYAAFVGCSAESEASFETISFLAKKVDECGLPCVMTIEGRRHQIAETIVKNTKGKQQRILTLDSMQSTTAREIEGGADYYAIMKKNLAVIKEALN